MNEPRLMIIVPCYNEEEVLNETNKELTRVLNDLLEKNKILEGSILYVDDGSKDQTWSIIERFAKEQSHVKGLKLAHNVGHQNALWAGMEWASHHVIDAIVSIDADLQDDTSTIEQMVDEYLNGNDVVFGVRKDRPTDTAFKKYSALAFYKLVRALGEDIVYNHADFRLISKQALIALMQYPERNLFIRGMVKSVGFNSTSVYYDRKERLAGETKYPLHKMFSLALNGITSFSIKPLRVITMVGVLFVLISIIMIAYGLYEWAIKDVIPGWTFLFMSVWFIGGVINIGIGIIGEYVGKIYKEVKQRPRYIIEKEI